MIGFYTLLCATALAILGDDVQAAPPVKVPHDPAVASWDASVLPDADSLPFPSGCDNPNWDDTNFRTCRMPPINGKIYDGPRTPSWDSDGVWSKWDIKSYRALSPIVGIHVAHIPGTDAYLLLGRSSEFSFGPDGDVVAGVYDFAANTFSNVSTGTNSFCSGPGITHDGRVISAGGTTEERDGGKQDGRDIIRIYDYQNAPAVMPDTKRMSYYRWYPTVTLLPDSTVFVIGGTKTATEISSPNDFFERWKPDNTLDVYPIESTYLPEMGKQFYPSVFVLPTGEVFILQDQYSRIIKPDGTFRYIGDGMPLRGPNYPSMWKTQFPHIGFAAMGALTYKNDYSSVDIMMHGGSPFPADTNASTWCPSDNRAKTIPANPYSYRLTISWTQTDGDWQYEFGEWVEESMGIPRVGGDVVLLPNGDSVILGGAQTGCSCGIRDGVNRGNYPALWPLMYQPEKPVGKRYTLLTAGSIARMYHGTATLTTDGTIMVQGCDACEESQLVTTASWWSGNPDKRYEFRIEEFSPPYALDKDAKPEITAIDGGVNTVTDVDYGETFTISWKPHTQGETDVEVTQVSLVAPSAVTHGFNANQRVVFLEIVSQDDKTLTVKVPETVAVLPPQLYKVFIMNGKTYSKAWWVKLTKPAAAVRRSMA